MIHKGRRSFPPSHFYRLEAIFMRPIQTVGVIGLGSLGVLYATLFTDALG